MPPERHPSGWIAESPHGTRPQTGGKVARVPKAVRMAPSPKPPRASSTGRGARPRRRARSPPRTWCVRRRRPRARIAGAAKMPASFSRTNNLTANTPTPAARNAAIAASFGRSCGDVRTRVVPAISFCTVLMIRSIKGGCLTALFDGRDLVDEDAQQRATIPKVMTSIADPPRRSPASVMKGGGSARPRMRRQWPGCRR